MAKKSVKTIADIARLAGVSKATVSRALNDSPLISQETRERTQALARKHNFKINVPAAEHLIRSGRKRIGFIHRHLQLYGR